MTEKTFPPHVPRTRDDVKRLVDEMDDNTVAAFIYVHQIGRVFTVISVLEETLVEALWICRKIVVDGIGHSLPDVEGHFRRKGVLRDKTFGNLIRILRENGLSEDGIAYFQFLKGKRDVFIHRFFHDFQYPGDLTEDILVVHIRQLFYYECVFNRALSRLWKILGSEMFDEVVDFGAGGILIVNDLSDIGLPVQGEAQEIS